uniref:Uncharacterized protein n=2 Tax=Enterococcus TaxID=1350 RepID=A0A286KC65_ENTAV|nr:hypothetical protein pEMA120_p72 [Enterococcus faecium]APB62508.1 hypothetical protein pEA19081_p12 [Enterococcus avium]
MDCCKCKLVVFYFQKFYCVSTLKSDYPIYLGESSGMTGEGSVMELEE